MEHHISIKLDTISLLIVLLPNIQKSFYSYRLDMGSLVHLIHIVDDTVESGVVLMTQYHLFLHLTSCCCAIRSPKSICSLHFKSTYFFDGELKFIICFFNLVKFNSDVDLWKLSVYLIINVTQFHPFINQYLRTWFIIFFIITNFLKIISLSRLVHLQPVTYSQP